MDSTTPKLYPKHEINSRSYLDIYFSGKKDMVFGDDSIKFPMVNFHYQFSSGQIEGTIVIDVCFGSFIHHLFSASNYFKEMFVIRLNEKCIMELSKWLNDHNEAYDWTHASAAAVELEGKRDKVQDKEMRLKSSIKQVVKCDFQQENITSPEVLPLADCVISGLLLESISTNEDEYMRNLGKILKLLKPGGKLVLFGALGSTYITIGGEKVHRFPCSEEFVKNALCKLGLVIDYSAVQSRRNVSDLTDYKAFFFIVACKGE